MQIPDMRQFCKQVLRLYMENSEALNCLNFKGGNPGAVRHGNFINYYQFHPPESRLKVLPKDIWGTANPFVTLDIGCNSGDLTVALNNFLSETLQQPCYTLGIDIDPTLIKRAYEGNQSNNIEFRCVNFMNTNEREAVIKNYLESLGVSKFSCIFCFSLTMWIHLNNGDKGLRTFLEDICKITSMIVIEPQPWKCYKAAVKRMKLSNEEFPQFKELEIRNDIEDKIEQILLNIKGVVKLTQTDKTEWGRIIQFYRIS